MHPSLSLCPPDPSACPCVTGARVPLIGCLRASSHSVMTQDWATDDPPPCTALSCMQALGVALYAPCAPTTSSLVAFDWLNVLSSNSPLPFSGPGSPGSARGLLHCAPPPPSAPLPPPPFPLPSQVLEALKAYYTALPSRPSLPPLPFPLPSQVLEALEALVLARRQEGKGRPRRLTEATDDARVC